MKSIELDQTDLELLSTLRADARISLTELANRVNYSVSGVRARVLRLQEAEVINRFTSIIDHTRLGFPLRFLAMMSKNGATSHSNVEEYLFCCGAVVHWYRVEGRYDYVFYLVARDTAAVHTLLGELAGYGEVHANLILEEHFDATPLEILTKPLVDSGMKE